MTTRHSAAALDKGLAVVKPEDLEAPLRPERGMDAYAGLVAHLFGRDAPRRVVAFASVDAGAGVSSIVSRLSAAVARNVGVPCSVVSAAELQASAMQRSGLVRAAGGFAGPLRPGDLAVEADYVLVDGGSLASGHILGIASRVDAVVLVVEAGKTRTRAVTQAINAISAAGGRVVGSVLNRRRRALPAWLERLLY